MAREKERITLLLEINSELLKHATNLQAQGLAGLIGSQQQPMEPAADNKAASEEYREYGPTLFLQSFTMCQRSLANTLVV